MTAAVEPASLSGTTRDADVVPFTRVEITEDAQQAALAVLRSGWVTTGPESFAFSGIDARIRSHAVLPVFIRIGPSVSFDATSGPTRMIVNSIPAVNRLEDMSTPR